jgi:hypothetical protein
MWLRASRESRSEGRVFACVLASAAATSRGCRSRRPGPQRLKTFVQLVQDVDDPVCALL